MSAEPRTVAAVAGGENGVVGVGSSGPGISSVSGGGDEAGDIAKVENGRECNNVGNGGGTDGGGVAVDDQLLQHDDSTVTVLHIPKRVKRMGKVDFVRFDPKETVYTDEHQDELITNKIKEEIKR